MWKGEVGTGGQRPPVPTRATRPCYFSTFSSFHRQSLLMGPFVHRPKRFSERRDGLSRMARVDQQRGSRPTRGLRTPVSTDRITDEADLRNGLEESPASRLLRKCPEVETGSILLSSEEPRSEDIGISELVGDDAGDEMNRFPTGLTFSTVC